MKKHITNEDFAELNAICHDWHIAKSDQAACVSMMIDLFGCDADEAVDLLNMNRTARGVVDSTATEVHNGSHCTPWPPRKIDGEACMVWLLIAGGATLAAMAAVGA